MAGDTVFYTYEELYSALYSTCNTEYKCQKPNLLDKNGKTDLARRMHYFCLSTYPLSTLFFPATSDNYSSYYRVGSPEACFAPATKEISAAGHQRPYILQQQDMLWQLAEAVGNKISCLSPEINGPNPRRQEPKYSLICIQTFRQHMNSLMSREEYIRQQR